MRRAQKQQAEELILQMGEAHDQIEKYIDENNIRLAMELLEDCQSAGITLGTLIENTEGEGHPTVVLLEEYCELVYQIHEGLTDAGDWNSNKVHKLLRQKLIKISSSIKNDIQLKIEAVFLPYKASMWDSLESVWKAADADENCDAYVIPIPYFDKNPDGSFREMHYEADQYPEYVPITNYEEYDFNAHHPDMVFIHNAYDAANFITSVHPFFYSDNLIKFTDKLIYIPYFVLGKTEPDNEKVIEGMQHFCTIPGILYADKVIVQSKKMRQAYIKVLTNAAGTDSRDVWEKKILGLGSPKFDRIENIKKEDLEIPEDWLKIIKKPDGSRKKVVFYNTGVSELLTYNEKMLEKIEEVLAVFRENQDKVALLWRPHPLLKATIESMRPRLWPVYEKIRNQYIEQRWGIYDDTTDIDRAIAISDAYYGASSSVVQMCEKAGKVIMIQSVETGEKL